jgi:DNA-binding LacI/PurR family transcriptional regulator
MRSSRPTLRSLAAEAGVSAMAFSLALRNSPEIAPKTRERLKRLARLRGYRPDPTITKLMQHLRVHSSARFRANICGLTQTRSWPSTVDFDERENNALNRRAREIGFAFGTIEIGADTKGPQLQRILLSRGVEGLVMMSLAGQCDLSELLDWKRFSVVSVTASVVAPSFHSVMPNHYDNMLRVCRELASRGYRRIGMAISRDWDERVRHRWTGGLAWQNEFGNTSPVPAFIDETRGPAVADPGFSAWLRRHNPDALVLHAIDSGLLDNALSTLPLRKRPKVITMNWPNRLADAGIDQRAEEIGTVAINLLAGMILQGERGIPSLANVTMVTGEWADDGLGRG